MSLLFSVIRITLIVVAVWVLVVWFSGAVYLAVSYFEAQRYVPKRPAQRVLASILREAWLIVWTQPMMPWFWFIAKRLGNGGGTVPVVMVHGYFQNRVDFLYLATRLYKAGCGPLYAVNFFWPQSLDRSSDDVLRFIKRVCAKTGASQVDMLTHSSGGLFVLDILAEKHDVIRRAALIAVPARGVPWRGPVIGTSGTQLRSGSRYQEEHTNRVDGVPVVSIYSAHDNMVHPVETSQLEGDRVTNVEVQDLGHLSVLFDREVGDLVVDFLLKP